MKAVTIDRFGGPEQLKLCEVPLSEIGEGEVLVRIEAAGLNLSDVMIRSGATGIPWSPNIVLGSEGAGIVEAVGSGVSDDVLGRRVLAAPFAVGRFGGTYATHIVLPVEAIFPLPTAIRADQAVALGVAGITAVGLVKSVPLKDRVVVVHSAAGGVGHILAQLAVARGSRCVIATVGTRAKAEMLHDLGIQHVVHSRQNWVAQVQALTGSKPPDVIFDAIGGEVSAQGLSALAPGGHFVAYGGASGNYAEISSNEMPAFVMGSKSLVGYSMASLFSQAGSPERISNVLDEIYAEVEAGRLTVHVGHHFDLSEASDAHRLLESRNSSGKILLRP